MPQFASSLTDDARVVIYNHKMLIIPGISLLATLILVSDTRVQNYKNLFCPKFMILCNKLG